MQDKSSRKRDSVMSLACTESEAVEASKTETSWLLEVLSGVPKIGAGNVKAAIREATRASGFSYGRVRKLWYREAAPWGWELDQLRERVRKARGTNQDALRGRNDEITSRLDRLEATLGQLRERLESSGADSAG